MSAPLFYNTLYGINYRLPEQIIAVGIYSIVHVVNRGATMILPNHVWNKFLIVL